MKCLLSNKVDAELTGQKDSDAREASSSAGCVCEAVVLVGFNQEGLCKASSIRTSNHNRGSRRFAGMQECLL